MSETPIADLVEKMLASSAPADLVVLAARALETSIAQWGAPPVRPTFYEKDRLRSKRYRDRRRANGMKSYFRGETFRAALMRRDGALCIYCGAEPGTDFDHFLPISQGGTDDVDNLGLACRPCNSRKSGRTPDEARMTFSAPTAQQAFERYLAAIKRADGARLKADGMADDGADASAPDALNLSSSSLLAESEQQPKEVRKKKERAPRKNAMPIPDDWQPSAAHFDAAHRLNVSRETLENKAEDMRIWARSNGTRKVDWDQTFHGFLRRAANELGPRSSTGRTSQPSFREIAEQLGERDESTQPRRDEAEPARDGELEFGFHLRA